MAWSRGRDAILDGLEPKSSVAPWTTPPFTPPPASHMVILVLWSRPQSCPTFSPCDNPPWGRPTRRPRLHGFAEHPALLYIREHRGMP